MEDQTGKRGGAVVAGERIGVGEAVHAGGFADDLGGGEQTCFQAAGHVPTVFVGPPAAVSLPG